MLTRRIANIWGTVNRLCPPVLRWVFCVHIMMLAGCASRVVTAPNPIEIDRVEYTRMYSAAVDVLREYGFRIDRQSHRFGVITTKELASPSAFEPWQRANTTSQQAWESTFNAQRRRVTISIEPVSSPKSVVDGQYNSTTSHDKTSSTAYRMRVEVFVERLQYTDAQLTGSTTGHGIVRSLSSTPTEMTKRGIHGSYWRPLGRDPYLEQRLIADIVRRSLDPDNIKQEKTD